MGNGNVIPGSIALQRCCEQSCVLPICPLKLRLVPVSIFMLLWDTPGIGAYGARTCQCYS